MTTATLIKLRALLEKQSEILRFDEEPALASLCACIALQFEMGNPDYDRLSPFFGFSSSQPWLSQIFSEGGEYKIQLHPQESTALEIRHRDFAQILDPCSLDHHGDLHQVVLAPAQIARNYQRRGFDLVIVRDWILASCLQLDAKARVTYLLANDWEITHLIARTQATLMSQDQLALFGTHDIVDHLLGANRAGFGACGDLPQRTLNTLGQHIPKQNAPYRKLILSYFLGVILDDLAQPRWYGSAKHIAAAERTLDRIRHCTETSSSKVPLSPDFHAEVAALRAPAQETAVTNFAARIATGASS